MPDEAAAAAQAAAPATAGCLAWAARTSRMSTTLPCRFKAMLSPACAPLSDTQDLKSLPCSRGAAGAWGCPARCPRAQHWGQLCMGAALRATGGRPVGEDLALQQARFNCPWDLLPCTASSASRGSLK